jgi:hypothetical protein
VKRFTLAKKIGNSGSSSGSGAADIEELATEKVVRLAKTLPS